MEEDKIKIIFDKIIIGIFTLLCFCAFFMVVKDLPYSISAIIGYDEYDGGYEYISFFVCCALLGYVMKYYDDKRKKELDEIRIRHFAELNALTNFYKLNHLKGRVITKISCELGRIRIYILEKYSVEIELYLFDKIQKEKDFLELDAYIEEYLKQNPITLFNKYEYNELIYNSRIEGVVKEYLENKK